MAKSYYEQQEEKERLALMGNAYAPEEVGAIKSGLPNAVDAIRMGNESRLNGLAESLAAGNRVQERSLEDQAIVDAAMQRQAADKVASQYYSSLNGSNRGTGVRGMFSRHNIMKNRAVREPELVDQRVATLKSQDRVAEMGRRREGFQAGEVAKTKFLADVGAEAIAAETAQGYNVANAETAQGYDVAKAETAQSYDETNAQTAHNYDIEDRYLEQRLENWKTHSEEVSGHGGSVASLKRALAVNDTVAEGKLTPLFAESSSVLRSFGLDIGGEQLNAYQEMQQAINSLLASDISVEGARGLTDKDMEILRKARIETTMTRETRDKILRLLIKDKEAGIDNYIEQYDSFTDEEKQMLGGVPSVVRRNRGGYNTRNLLRERKNLKAKIIELGGVPRD